MEQQTSGIDRDFIISFFLPDGMIDWFEVVNMTEENNPGTTIADKLYNRILNIYLDEQYGLFFKDDHGQPAINCRALREALSD